MSFVPTRSGPIASNAPSVMLSGESLTGRRGAAALSRTPATVSEPAEPAPSRAMNPPPVPGGEIEEAPLNGRSNGDVESGDAPSRAPHRVPPPAQAWTMIIGACVVLVLMFGMFGTTAVMRQRVRDSTLEQIPNADGSAETRLVEFLDGAVALAEMTIIPQKSTRLAEVALGVKRLLRHRE